MSNKSFRERYKYWKETGELPYSNGLIKDLPENQSEGVPVKSRLPGYDGGKDGMFVKYVDSYRVNPETGGVYDKVGDVREGAVILDPVEVVGLKPEWMRMQEEAERMRNILSRQGLSGADPIGLFAVETVALNPVFKALGTAGLYTLGRYGESLTGFAKPLNWARAKLLTREMDRSPFGTIGNPVLQSTKRTKVGDVEIDNPGLYYHQSDAGKAKHFVETGRMRTPLEEYWLAKEEAGEPIPMKIRSGIEPGFPQDPGSAMFAQGGLWYGLTPKKPDLLVTAREMPIANKNASVMSNRASLKKLEAQGSRRVTNDNIYTQGPHNRQNTTAYSWEPGYGYRRVSTESPTTIEWSDALKPITALDVFPNQSGNNWLRQTANRLGINVNHYYNNLITPEELRASVKNAGFDSFVSEKDFVEPSYIPSGFPYGLKKSRILMPYDEIRKMPIMAPYTNLSDAEFRKIADDLIGSHEFTHWYNRLLAKNINSGRMKAPAGYLNYELTWNGGSVPPGVDDNALGDMIGYMEKSNGTEFNARTGQLFNAFGILKGLFVPQHINLAKKFYRQVYPDNQMSLFLNSISDKNSFAQWANKNAGTLFGTVPIGIIGYKFYNK